MDDSDNKHWLDQLEVTGPIKGIMSFVDELSHNYERRLAALHIEYQKDVEEILACYKGEKAEFLTQLEEQKAIIAALETDLKAMQQSYKHLNVEYKMNKDSLETCRQELSELTKALKTEDELLELAKRRIDLANDQLKVELRSRGISPDPIPDLVTRHLEDEILAIAAKPRKIRFKKTKAVIQLITLNRLSRPVILRPKKDPLMTDKFDEPQQETIKPKKTRFKRTKALLKLVVPNRLSRPVISRSKKEPVINPKFDEPEQESF